ncbi:MAG: hypothetical protein QOK72_10620 [Nitrososphaeraceae archaeon]|nr:hypothetical protein [Nitrososphaeraceae archaeon]
MKKRREIVKKLKSIFKEKKLKSIFKEKKILVRFERSRRGIREVFFEKDIFFKFVEQITGKPKYSNRASPFK